MAFMVQTVTSNVLVTRIQNVTLTMEHVGAPWVILESGAVRVRYVNTRTRLNLEENTPLFLCSTILLLLLILK